jgi:hypothetical protein
MEHNEPIIPDVEVLMRVSAFDTIDDITTELLNIEESARLALGEVICDDRLLIECNMPCVADLMQLPFQPVWAYPEFM